ncbi:hypothetical protein ARMGADRAFT_1036324 [Armillaria gallica]|uniref:Uncharacterized protein n=1 Tax=Armillaria gallica TaxID=47427 RepID=A0A2H3DBE1_ARMGA|nr:hypothetical protein ARMGADRAFT_1036324 [Armillaria gallica]
MFLDAKHTGNPSRVRELVHLVDRTWVMVICFLLVVKTFQLTASIADLRRTCLVDFAVRYSAWSPAWYHAGVKLSLEYQLSFEDGVGGIFERLAAQSWRSQCQQKSGDGDDNWVQVDMLRRYSSKIGCNL